MQTIQDVLDALNRWLMAILNPIIEPLNQSVYANWDLLVNLSVLISVGSFLLIIGFIFWGMFVCWTDRDWDDAYL